MKLCQIWDSKKVLIIFLGYFILDCVEVIERCCRLVFTLFYLYLYLFIYLDYIYSVNCSILHHSRLIIVSILVFHHTWDSPMLNRPKGGAIATVQKC